MFRTGTSSPAGLYKREPESSASVLPRLREDPVLHRFGENSQSLASPEDSVLHRPHSPEAGRMITEVNRCGRKSPNSLCKVLQALKSFFSSSNVKNCQVARSTRGSSRMCGVHQKNPLAVSSTSGEPQTFSSQSKKCENNLLFQGWAVLARRLSEMWLLQLSVGRGEHKHDSLLILKGDRYSCIYIY